MVFGSQIFRWNRGTASKGESGRLDSWPVHHQSSRSVAVSNSHALWDAMQCSSALWRKHAQLRHPFFGHWDYRPFIGQIRRCQTLFTCPAVGTSFLQTCPNRSLQQAHQGVSGAFTAHVFFTKCDKSKVYLLNHANRGDLEQAGSPSRSLQTGPS